MVLLRNEKNYDIVEEYITRFPFSKEDEYVKLLSNLLLKSLNNTELESLKYKNKQDDDIITEKVSIKMPYCTLLLYQKLPDDMLIELKRYLFSKGYNLKKELDRLSKIVSVDSYYHIEQMIKKDRKLLVTNDLDKYLLLDLKEVYIFKMIMSDLEFINIKNYELDSISESYQSNMIALDSLTNTKVVNMLKLKLNKK